MRLRIFNDNRAIYYDTKKAKLIAKFFATDDFIYPSYEAKFLYRTDRGNWFFYENEIYDVGQSGRDDDLNVRQLSPCTEFEALRFLANVGRMDLAKKYGLTEEDA